MRRAWLATALIVGLTCSSGSGGGGGGGDLDPSELAVIARLVEAFGGRVFDSPVKLVQHPTDDDRWYVVQQRGVILTFLASDPVAVPSTPAVNINDHVVGTLSTGFEQGALGMAFAPDFVTSGEVYFAYTYSDESILARYESSDAGLTFAPATDPIVLAIPHPRPNHNGGDIFFGVADPYLYYTMGDGGGGGDPDENGQDVTTLLGSVMRLDVDGAPPPGRSYAIPPSNPFAGNPVCDTGESPVMLACPEIWAYGLRNPWRAAFDPKTGELWLGDVGQISWEEIDRVERGGNHGWDCLEGDADFENVGDCLGEAFVAPEAVHPRAEARAITGGAVYRGSTIPDLEGFYVYGDFSRGNFWALDTTSADPPVKLDLPTHAIAAFGQGRDGEVYVVTHDSPSIIYSLVPAP